MLPAYLLDLLALAGGGGVEERLLPLLLLLLGVLGVAVEEQVGHDLPRHLAGDGAAQAQDLPASTSIKFSSVN